MFVHLGREKDPFYTAMKLIDLFYTELEPYSDRIGIVKNWKEIEENRKAGKDVSPADPRRGRRLPR